jgi:hypothetical protein
MKINTWRILHTWRWPCRLKHVVKDSGKQHAIKLHVDGDITCNINWQFRSKKQKKRNKYGEKKREINTGGRQKRRLAYLPGVFGGGCCSLKEWRRLSRSLRRLSPLPSLWYAASERSRAGDGFGTAAGRSSLSHRVSVPGPDSCPSHRPLQQKAMTLLGNGRQTR